MILQDRKFLIHVSVEIIIIGTITYFLNNKNKKLERRLKDLEEEMLKMKTFIQNNANDITLLKKIKEKPQQAFINPRMENIIFSDFFPQKQSSNQNINIEEITDIDNDIKNKQSLPPVLVELHTQISQPLSSVKSQPTSPIVNNKELDKKLELDNELDLDKELDKELAELNG